MSIARGNRAASAASAASARSAGSAAAGTAATTGGAPATKAARHARIEQLLARTPVRSQAELSRLLAADGFSVTQATLSRDLDEIGAVRVRGAGRGLGYVVPSDGPAARGAGAWPPSDRSAAPAAALTRLTRVAAELLVSVRASANLVVAKTPPGGAHLLASAIDHADLPAIIGTVAGDDTVLCICRDLDGGVQVAEQLHELADRRAR